MLSHVLDMLLKIQEKILKFIVRYLGKDNLFIHVIPKLDTDSTAPRTPKQNEKKCHTDSWQKITTTNSLIWALGDPEKQAVFVSSYLCEKCLFLGIWLKLLCWFIKHLLTNPNL